MSISHRATRIVAVMLAAAPLLHAPASIAVPQKEEPKMDIKRARSQPSQAAPAEYFTGSVRLSPLSQTSEPSRLGGASVSFEAGARTAWHTHPAGQTLIVTGGVGRVQRWGGPVEEMRPGDVVQIPPGVKHWHGAAPSTSMTHVALAESQNGKAVDWLEKVSDEQYNALVQAPPAAAVGAGAQPVAQGAQPSRAQVLMGDIAPKLAELTDQVLLGDVWERPGLSKHDRSLVTVSALVAMNRPDQLRSHIALARQNGVTQDEIIEAITQLAFYSGWPNAITAIGVAREVFQQK